MKITVSHNPKACDTFGDFETNTEALEAYKMSKEVVTYLTDIENVDEALENAFYLTNSIDSAWFENFHKLNIKAEESRSTSVHDFVTVIETGSSPVTYAVAGCGFTKVTNIKE